MKGKSVTNNILRTKSDDYTMCGFYCITFTEYFIANQTLFHDSNMFFANEYKKVTRHYISNLKRNMAKINFKPWLYKNFILKETYYNEVMREKHKNVCRALDFFQSFLVFIFVVSGCILICFISRCSCAYCEFFSWIKKLWNDSKN